MSVGYSYDNFSTKGHGVIEGVSRPRRQLTQEEIRNSRKNNRPLYSIIRKVPKSFRANQMVTSNIDAYLGLITNARAPLYAQIVSQLHNGQIIRIENFVIKQAPNNDYAVYTNKQRS